MTILTRVLGAVAAVFLSTAAQATTLDFDFTFGNEFFEVTGFITGLEDDTFGQEADSVVVTSNTLAGFGLGDYVNDPTVLVIDHAFSVVGGEIVFAEFVSVLVPNSLLALSTTTPFTRLEGIPGVVGGELVFTQISAVPLPAGGLLVLTALGALVGLGRRRGAI